MSREFILPDLGEGIVEAQIIRVLIKSGDKIEEDQYLMEVETDKAAVEIPSPYAGIAQSVHVEDGQTVKVGDVIVTFDDGNGQSAPAGQQTTKVASKVASSGGGTATIVAPSPAAPAAKASRKTTAAAAPAVRKLAREMGIDLDTVQGTGPGGRVVKNDLERHAPGQVPATSAPAGLSARPLALPAAPLPGEVGSDKWGSIRTVPLNQIRKTIAAQMARSAFTIPHVTHCDEADLTKLESMRQGLNEATGDDPKLTVMSFMIRAICLAVRKFPMFNASFDEEGGQIIYKDYINLGIAVDTERGLIVPSIRNAHTLSMRGIAGQLRSLAEKIRSNQFSVDDLRGGTFTITNVGALGGTFTTPIINHPEVAILGLGRSRKVPIIRNDEVMEALTMPLSLSFDHRATDGANAARFMREIISYLETPAMFLLD